MGHQQNWLICKNPLLKNKNNSSDFITYDYNICEDV